LISAALIALIIAWVFFYRSLWRFHSITILSLLSVLIGAVLISGFVFLQREKSKHYKMMLALNSEKQQAESQRRQLFDILEKSLNEIYVFDSKTLKFQYVNSGALNNLHYSLEEIKELTPLDIKPAFTEERFRAMIRPLLENEQDSLVFETLHRRAGGTDYPVEVHLQLIDAEPDRVFLAVIFDITEHKRTQSEQELLQSQLIQAQKMESIGRLAGGIAHDFNNLLSIILGYGEMLQENIPLHHSYREPLQEIHSAALRAKDLTRQLLAFSRKQVLHFNSIDLNQVIDAFKRLLSRLLGEEIELRIHCSKEPLYVMADTSQLEQVFMNLAVNARDAMEKGGILTIETRKATLDEAYTEYKKQELTPGIYAQISISDTGCGMNKEILSRIFEPFFTTKEEDSGTGLGLATSYGIIKQHNGGVWVYSEPGIGTAFHIFFPLSSEPAIGEVQSVRISEIAISDATILVVEDDSSLRKLIVRMLKTYGCNVLESESAEDAIHKAAQYSSPIHLVLTDVIMPKMRGPEVFEKIVEKHSESNVLYMSGYADDILTRKDLLRKGFPLIQKPFTATTLLEKVKSTLHCGTIS
jgi:two-component system, cell cycle sensor histidine kinase and response regulator CckA